MKQLQGAEDALNFMKVFFNVCEEDECNHFCDSL